eukprot:6427744-Pyramimonas_sp.AAC.1
MSETLVHDSQQTQQNLVSTVGDSLAMSLFSIDGTRSSLRVALRNQTVTVDAQPHACQTVTADAQPHACKPANETPFLKGSRFLIERR